MTFTFKKLIIPLILMVVIILSYSYVHVSGNEIDFLSEVDEYCIVTVSQYEHMLWAHRTEYLLDYSSVLELQSLLLESDFTRTFGNYVITQDTDRYFITFEFNDHQRHIAITVLGNDYILITDQYDGSHLRIRNNDFEKSLYEIIH